MEMYGTFYLGLITGFGITSIMFGITSMFIYIMINRYTGEDSITSTGDVEGGLEKVSVDNLPKGWNTYTPIDVYDATKRTEEIERLRAERLAPMY